MSLKNFFENFKDVMWLASMIVASAIYVFSNFATQSALAEKEKNLTAYVDQRHDEVQRQLSEMKVILYRIDQRVYEIQRLDKR